MKTNYFLNIIVMLVVALGTTVSFSSCDDDENSEIKVDKSEMWYALQSDINDVSIRKSDFNEIEKAIDEHELLGRTYVTTNRYIYYYAERDMFVFSDGSFGTYDTKKLGRLANTIEGSLNAVRIQDSNTLVLCHFSLYVDEDMKRSYNDKKYATVFNGHIFKSISVYLSEYYYTYYKTGNKIIASNGDIYTVTSNGLIKDGSSSVMISFNPKKLFDNTNEEENITPDINKDKKEPMFEVMDKSEMNGKGSYVNDPLSKELYGKYFYSFQFGFGIDENAYRDGITKIVAHLKIDSGYLKMANKKDAANIDVQLDIKEPKQTNFWDLFAAVSPNSSVTISYSFDYYKDGVKHVIPVSDSYTIIAK